MPHNKLAIYLGGGLQKPFPMSRKFSPREVSFLVTKDYHRALRVLCGE
jgi:hypothetical protein